MKTIVDEIRLRAQEQPAHPALVERQSDGKEKVVDYGELVRRMDRLVESWATLSCHRSDRCGLLAPQGSDFIIASLAILEKGLCLVPISDDYSGNALTSFQQKAGLHFLLDLESSEALVQLEPPGPLDGLGDEAFRSLNPAYLRFTSGTTHSSKGVIISHPSILERLQAANRALQIHPDDRIVWLLPMAHHLVVSIFLYLRFGATILLPGSHLPAPVLSQANDWKVSVFYASPYHYDLLSQETGQWPETVRLAISTASGLSLHAAKTFLARTGTPLSQALGVIEAGLPAINIQRPAEKPMSLGQVLPDYQIWLRADDGSAVTETGADTGVGEICIRGPGLFDAYLHPWRPASEVLEPDGFRTGDLGYFDDDGDLFLLGRRHNRINMGGMKFFCEEVEAEINTHPLVRECRVYGEPHPHLGEIPQVEIVLNSPSESLDISELSDYCKPRLSRHKIPLSLNIVEVIEKTPTGKVRRW